MSKYFQSASGIALTRSLFAAAIAIGCALGATTCASAQTVTPPPTPTQITPEAGNSAFLVGHAFGSQGYTCLPTNTGGTSWTVNPARPEATLFTSIFGQPLEIITHFASINESPKEGIVPPLSGNATWQSSFDSSRVWAATVPGGVVVAGTDPESCPNNGSIPCLLLQSVGNKKGPAGGRLLANTTFVQRLNTNGGAAPTSSCSVGQTQLVPYTADYYFYHQDQ
jgi:Protein of unknown function (DUF3455)